MGTTPRIIFKHAFIDLHGPIDNDQILLALPFLVQLADLQLQIFDGRPQRIRELTPDSLEKQSMGKYMKFMKVDVGSS